MTNTQEGMKYLTKINTGIVFGNGQRLKATYIGEKAGSVIQKNGETVPILIKNVKYVPDLYCNLFSISAMLKKRILLGRNSQDDENLQVWESICF